MTTKNAAKFLDDVGNNESLRSKLLAAGADARGWLAGAASAGYQLTADELRAAAELVLGKPVAADNLANVLNELFASDELDDAALDGVAGGAGPAQPIPAQRTLQVQTTPGGAGGAQASYVGERGPIKVHGFNPGGNQSQGG